MSDFAANWMRIIIIIIFISFYSFTVQVSPEKEFFSLVRFEFLACLRDVLVHVEGTRKKVDVEKKNCDDNIGNKLVACFAKFKPCRFLRNFIFLIVECSVADPDPGPGDFLTPGSGVQDPGSRLGKKSWLKIFKLFDADADPGSGIFLTLDLGSGMEKFGSGINNPDPQHW